MKHSLQRENSARFVTLTISLVSLPAKSLLAPSSTTVLALPFRPSQSSAPAVSWVALHSTASAHLTLTPFLN